MIFLAGDRPMRERCAELQVECRGSIWIVEEMFHRNLCDGEELMRWLDVGPTVGRRLPAAELQGLMRLLSAV